MRYTHSHTHMHKCLWIYSNMKLRYKSCLVRSLCSNTKYHSIQCLLSVWVQFTIEYLSVSDSTYLFCSVDANVYVGLLEMICCCCYFCWGFDVDILFEIQHPFIRSFVRSVCRCVSVIYLILSTVFIYNFVDRYTYIHTYVYNHMHVLTYDYGDIRYILYKTESLLPLH